MAYEKFNQAHFFGDIGPTLVTLTVDNVTDFAVDDVVTQAVTGATGVVTAVDATTPALSIQPEEGSAAFTYARANAITNTGTGSCVASALTDVEIAFTVPGTARSSGTIIDLWASTGVSYYLLKIDDGIGPVLTAPYLPGSKKLRPGATLTVPPDYDIKKITAVPYDSSDDVIQAGILGYMCFMGVSSPFSFSLVV